MHDIFSAQPSTEAGKMAMVWVICNTDSDWEKHVRAVEMFMAYHGPEALASKAVHLDRFHPIYETALRRIASAISDHESQADCLLHLAGLLVERSRYRQLMQVTPEDAADRIKNLGVATVEHLESTVPKRDREEARLIYHKLIKEYGQVPYRHSTVAKESEKRLAPLEQSFPEIGQPAPGIIGQDLKGNEIKLSELRGKVVVLAFWASWCEPCLARIPEENKLVEKFAGRPFELIGICGDDSPAVALHAVERHGIRFRNIMNDSSNGPPVTETFGIERWPSTIVLDRSGVIRYRDLTDADLEDAIRQLLDDQPKKSER